MKFKPLWPLSHREVALYWFYSDSESANKGFMTAGSFAFVFYIIYSSGALDTFIK